MTQKELLYFEDAIGHVSNIIKILEESIKNVSDDEILSFMEEEINCQSTLKETLMTKLKEKANG